ncbi:hypothetical protein AX769_12615 [Frondihabitans sp. PAMC 28766]|uniref:helix-turn-helix domain-containing protein n=1 Tax=Frondihabitans sp. PAMC 28766 TaxID=1795630 RepID=UPI00078C5B17|nr:XRE family transcriptional regulator [Frondihabitans sp. PAMC 28766]AMM20828.1 hypothetical protein AX769_12615 [Frondihabitans sp. PAMC 28766]
METPDALQTEIGQAVRAERTRRGWSMRELAGRAGVSQPFLSNVENARIYPSVPTLYALASALDIPPAQLMPVVGSPEAPPVHLPATEGSTDTARLVAGGPGRALESYLFDLGPGYADEPAFSHEGEDVVHVLEGMLDVVSGEGEPVRLTAGATLWLDGVALHGWRVPADAPRRTRVLLVTGGRGRK